MVSRKEMWRMAVIQMEATNWRVTQQSKQAVLGLPEVDEDSLVIAEAFLKKARLNFSAETIKLLEKKFVAIRA